MQGHLTEAFINDLWSTFNESSIVSGTGKESYSAHFTETHNLENPIMWG